MPGSRHRASPPVVQVSSLRSRPSVMVRLTTPADECELSVRELVLKNVKVEAENS